jgi:hypothetical protein
MISNSVKKGPVKIARDTAASWSTANPHSRTNVNVAQGPRTGNPGTIEKRHAFTAAKEARQPLADEIERAYKQRQLDDYADHDFPGEGAISENNPVRHFAHRRAR